MWNAAEERQGLAIIDNYLGRTEKVTKQQKIEFLKVADQMGKNNQHKKLVQHAYSSLKKHLSKSNFIPTCKRFLILFDQLLQNGPRRESFARYQAPISNILVQCFIYVFSLIFQYAVLEAAIDWKVYRMLWAKDIKDTTFDALRTEIRKNYRHFDLNKGFSQQNLERIKKRYHRKGFSETEIQRYMEGQINDTRQEQEPSQPRKSSHDRLSAEKFRKASEEIGASPRRIPLSQQPPLQRREPTNRRSTSPASFIQDRSSPSGQRYSTSARIPVGQPVDPRRNMPIYDVPQMQPPFGFPNIYQGGCLPSYPYGGNQLQPPSLMNYSRHPMEDFSQSSSHYFPNNVVVAPEHCSSQEVEHHQVPLVKTRSEPTAYYEKRAKNQAYKELLRNLYDALFDCKNCGLCFQSKANLKAHEEQHVLEAQNQILSKQYNKACDIPGAAPLSHSKVHQLLSLDDWLSGQKQQEEEVQQQIAIQREANRYSFTCHFCQEELEVNWCESLEDWTLKDSVKVRDEHGTTSVAHLNCFKEFSAQPQTQIS